jgi:hypothetical protein
MKSDKCKTYTLESYNELVNSKQVYYMLIGSWFALLMIWALLEASFMVLVGPLVVTILVLFPTPKYLKRKINIVISDDTLSIHEGDATLWVTLLRDITSIEYVERSLFQLGARKSIIIRNNKDDSYYQALDGMSFDSLEISDVINELKDLVNNP